MVADARFAYEKDDMTDEIMNNQGMESAPSVENQMKQGNSAQDVPSYGRKASEFPGWNPYVYGRPEKEASVRPHNNNVSARLTVVPVGPKAKKPADAAHGNAVPQQQTSYGENAQAQNNQQLPFYDRNGNPINFPVNIEDFDPDDPKKNPLYGRWDGMAIVAFILSLFDFTTIFGLVIGIFSMIRTRKLHMKGFVFALFAVILGVIEVIVVVYLLYTGTSRTEFLEQIMHMAQLSMAWR